MTNLTPASAALLAKFRREAFDDHGTGVGNLALFDGELTAAQRGNLTDLKAKGLIRDTGHEDWNDHGPHVWYEVDMTTAITTTTTDDTTTTNLIDYNVHDKVHGDVDEWFDDHEAAMRFYDAHRDLHPTLTVTSYPVTINEHGHAITDVHNGVTIAAGLTDNDIDEALEKARRGIVEQNFDRVLLELHKRLEAAQPTATTATTILDEWRTQVNATMKKLYGITIEDAGVSVEYLELTSAANHDPREWVEWFAEKHELEHDGYR